MMANLKFEFDSQLRPKLDLSPMEIHEILQPSPINKFDNTLNRYRLCNYL